jgi:hypothetical protein
METTKDIIITSINLQMDVVIVEMKSLGIKKDFALTMEK